MFRTYGHYILRIPSPCKDCERRELGCHDRCGDYISYKKELIDSNNARVENINANPRRKSTTMKRSYENEIPECKVTSGIDKDSIEDNSEG